MEFLTNKKNIKIISLLLIILAIFSFVNPIAVYAEDEDETFGGKLFKPIAKLVCGIGDGVIMGLQKMFVGYWGITDEQYETESTKSTVYQILYSPGIIFSNKVPALNADFINPPDGKYQVEIEKSTELNQISGAQYAYIMGSSQDNGDYKKEKEKECLDTIKADEYGYSSSTKTEIQDTEQKNQLLKALAGMISNGKLYKWEYDKNNDGTKEVYYLLINYTSMTSTSGGTIPISTTTNVVEYSLYDDSKSTIEKGDAIEYSAAILQKIIAKWYRALRLIAIVGLMSVLVYVGIRIIISSTGQEKAKYKKMIVDWLAAICILFVLQYIMSFTTTIVSEIIDIFPQIQGQEGQDVLMSDIRTEIASSGGTFWNVFGETIMYVALVTLTCVFTVHYLKRLVYLAFLTMIAPLIALTYPLDKIKDRTSTSIYNVDKRICVQFINTSSSYINIHYICNISDGACRRKSIICCCVYRFHNTCRKVY